MSEMITPSIFSTPDRTTPLSPFYFLPGDHIDDSIQLSGAAAKNWRLGRHRRAAEVVEWIEETGGVRGVIGTRADEVLTETPPGTRHSSALGPEGDEVMECDVSEGFEEFELVNDEVYCHTCVEEEWLMRKCCSSEKCCSKDDIHPSEQKNDDVNSKMENPDKDYDEKYSA